MILSDEQLAVIKRDAILVPIDDWMDTIADLKHQLAEAVRTGTVAESDREGGVYWTKAALDAYVQEQVERKVKG